MSKLGRVLRALAHTRPRQLAWRLARISKRVAHERLGWVERLDASRPALAPAPPRALFAARAELVADANEPSARVLATTHSLRAPIDWRPRGWSELATTTLHYTEFLEALDDDQFTRVVTDWIASNPLSARGSRELGWSSYALSLRTVVWMQQLAQRRERVPTDVAAVIDGSLALQLRFLERNLELDLGGNHLIKNAKALLWAGSYFDGDEARRWLARGREILLAELDEQILADGMHYERSPAYHAQVFADLLECATLVDDVRLRAKLDLMAQVVADTTHPDRSTSLFNDGGLHMSYAPGALLAAYRTVTGVHVVAREVFALPDAGYFGARTGDSFVLADCGAIAPDHLPAHGHGDALAFEWSVAGRRVIVDAGVFEYERGALRDLSRSTSAHNTVTLDGSDQCEFWASFRVGRRARARVHLFAPRANGFVLEGSHDGYAHLVGRPIHVRKLTALRDALEIDDEILGGAGQRVHARLLLHPDARVALTEKGVSIALDELTFTLATELPVALAEALWCPDFGVRRATVQIVVDLGFAPCRGRIALRRATAAVPEPAHATASSASPSTR